ncbi:MAG: transposase [Candidatus Zixiibacteriota bacterium]
MNRPSWVMGLPHNRPTRRSVRLRGYDYTRAGAYFLTICTEDRAMSLGIVGNDSVVLNTLGQVVADSWLWLARQYDYVELDEWIIMPNHLHGIVVVGREDAGGSRTAPTAIPDVERKSIGRVVGAFKTVSTKHVNRIKGTPGATPWQRNYYEHVIRDDDELNRVRLYIQCNPARWAMDRENPSGIVPVPVDGDCL